MTSAVRICPSKRHWLILLPGFSIVAYIVITRIEQGIVLSGPHGPQTFFFAACLFVVFFAALVIDIYKNFIKRSHISMNSYGIVDEFSDYRFGSISWDVIDSVSIQRQFLGASVTMKFKSGARRHNGMSYPEAVSIGTLAISDDQLDVIGELFQESRKNRQPKS